MRHPVDKVKISQLFGNKLYINGVDIYARFGLDGHNGVDYAVPTGTPIYAPHDGTILERRYDAGGYGYYLKIQSDKEGSVLAHLKSFAVNINKKVREGDLVGYSGNTGLSTGPHLHWGYYPIPRNRQNGYNGYINQLPLSENENMSNELEACLSSFEKVMGELTQTKKDYDQYKSEAQAKIADLEREKAQYATEAKEFKTAYQNLVRDLSNLLGTTQTPAQILAEVEKLVDQEDESIKAVDKLREETLKWNHTKRDLENEIAKLKMQLESNDLSDQDPTALLVAFIRSIIKIIKE